MGISAGPAYEGDTQKLPNLRLLNEIHHRMGEISRGSGRGSWPRFVFLGRLEYEELKHCGLELYFMQAYSNQGIPTDQTREYVMGLEIVQVDRDEFMMVA